LIEFVESLRVISSDCFDSTDVVHVLAMFVAEFSFREVAFLDQVVSCLDVVESQVVSDQKVKEGLLTHLVLSDVGSV